VLGPKPRIIDHMFAWRLSLMSASGILPLEAQPVPARK